MKKLVIGIDPGMSGGIAVIDECGVVLSVSRMPDTMQDVYEWLSEYSNVLGLEGYDYSPVCYIEDVGRGMPGQSSSATAKFARHCGHLEMALLALRIPTNMVTPQKWMRSYQLGKSSGHDKREWKNILKSKAQQLFPCLGKRVTLATCDALLIAEYGRLREVGTR